jgi:hypothetical protein
MDCRVKLLQQDSGLQRAAFSKATGSRSPKDDHLSGKDCRIGAKQLEMLQAAVSRMASGRRENEELLYHDYNG